MKKFSMSGTLGDAFIVYCKLYDYWKRTGENVGVYRYSRHVNFDKPIGEFFKNIPFVEYLSPCRYIETPVTKEDKLIAPYINASWNGYGFGKHKNDPKGIKMEPFPEIFIEPDRKTDQLKGKNFGIQLHCGTVGHNFAGFSVSWVVGVAQRLKNLEATVHVLGTGSGYNKRELKQLDQISNIQNWVGKTKVLEWLSLIKSTDALISFHGFSALFAMSQCVPTFSYNQNSYGIMGRIHPAWRDTSRIVNLNFNRIVGKLRYLKTRKLGMRNLFSPINHKELNMFLRNVLQENRENAAGNR